MQNPSVVFGKGIFLLDDTISLFTANRGITFIGSRGAALQQGSTRPATTLRWVGGAKAMFDVSAGHVNWIDMAVENVGNGKESATNFACFHPASKILLRRVACWSGATGPVTQPFNESFIKVRPPGVSYSTIDDCEFAAAAPIIFDLEGLPSANTWIHFLNNMVDSAPIGIDQVVFRIKDFALEQLEIVGNTFNAQQKLVIKIDPNTGQPVIDPNTGQPVMVQVPGDTLTVVDTTLIGRENHLGNLIFHDNEYDDDSLRADARLLKLLRCMNADIENNNLQGNGQNEALIEMTDSVAHVGKNVASSIGVLIKTLDDVSHVFFKHNNVIPGTVTGLINNDTSAAIVAMSPLPAHPDMVPIYGYLGDPGGMTTFQFDTPDNQNYTIIMATPADSQSWWGPWGPGYMTRGQKVLVVVRNIHGGTVAFSNQFKMSGVFNSPAAGKSRAILFEYVGTVDYPKDPNGYMVERWCGTADVSN